MLFLGLSLGFFTPTPAAAIACGAILLWGGLAKYTGIDGGLGLVEIKSAVLEIAVTVGMMCFILFGAEVLKVFFARAGLSDWLGGGLTPWTARLLFLGCCSFWAVLWILCP